MKKLFIALILLINSALALSSDCHDLMRAFLKFDTKVDTHKKIIPNKTADMDITKFGLVDNILNREKFERLYLQCMSSNKTQLQSLAHQRFSTANKTLGYATTIVGYSQQNWEKPKDKEWFERLGYGLIFGAVARKVHSKLIKHSTNRFHYLVKDFLFGRGASIFYFAGINTLFDNNKATREKLERLKSSPTFKQDMEELQKYSGNLTLVKRYQEELISYFSHLDVIDLDIGVHDGVDFNNLKPSDLEDPDIQEVAVAAILAKEYEQKKEILNITGDKNDDFFIFDSLYFIAKTPKDRLVNSIIDRVMCLNTYNVRHGLALAVGISVLDRILFADYYSITYRVLKKELINQ